MVVVAPSVHWQDPGDGQVLIEYPLDMKPFYLNLLSRFGSTTPERKPTRKLQLDGLGSRVWRAIDGRKSVRELIDEFAADTTMTRQEAETSVTMFLRELGKRGLILIR